jgi:hypothetical protein
VSNLLEQPTEIAGLEDAVSKVYDYLHIDQGSETTVSLIIRDGDSHEILGETPLYPRPGVYALTRVTDEPSNPNEYGIERPEPPSWVEWRHSEPPLDHFVNGVECSECGEDCTFPRGNPETQGETSWSRLLHNPACPYADPDTEQRWWDRVARNYVEDRPSPSRMALDCIWREADWLYAFLREDRSGTVTDAIEQRLRYFQKELESRLAPRYPDCPVCGRTVEFGVEGYPRCSRGHDLGDHARQDWQDRQDRLWGRRGHGDRGTPRRTGGDEGG